VHFAETDFMSSESVSQHPAENNLFGLLTPEQLARQLNVKVRTLQQWHLERTGPPPTKVGRQVFYRVASVEKWLASRERRR
jgi:hypothetical protein